MSFLTVGYTERKDKENMWIKKLHTKYPLGLNFYPL